LEEWGRGAGGSVSVWKMVDSVVVVVGVAVVEVEVVVVAGRQAGHIIGSGRGPYWNRKGCG
jgi:NCAIR mutase (PurE)-related protein